MNHEDVEPILSILRTQKPLCKGTFTCDVRNVDDLKQTWNYYRSKIQNSFYVNHIIEKRIHECLPLKYILEEYAYDTERVFVYCVKDARDIFFVHTKKNSTYHTMIIHSQELKTNFHKLLENSSSNVALLVW